MLRALKFNLLAISRLPAASVSGIGHDRYRTNLTSRGGNSRTVEVRYVECDDRGIDYATIATRGWAGQFDGAASSCISGLDLAADRVRTRVQRLGAADGVGRSHA